VTVFSNFKNGHKQQPNYRLNQTPASTIWRDRLTTRSGVTSQPYYSPRQVKLCVAIGWRRQDWRVLMPLSDAFVWRLSDVWRLCVTYIGSMSRTERPRKTEIGTDTTFKVKRSRSPGRFAHHRVGVSGSCSGGCENVLAVGNCCYVVVCSAAQRTSAPMGRRGAGAYRGGRPPQLVLTIFSYLVLLLPYFKLIANSLKVLCKAKKMSKSLSPI